MTGFLKKDLYLFSGLYRKNLTLVCVLYAAMYLFSGIDLFLYMLIVMMGFYTLSTLTLDDASGWNRYARTLPVRSTQIVGGKYLLALLSVGAAVVYALILGFLGSFVREVSLAETALASLVCASVSIFILSFLFPAAWKWGVDKARNTLLLVFVAFFGGGMFLLNRMQGDTPPAWLQTRADSPTFLILLCVSALLLSLICYGISFALSCALFEKKEF